MTFPSQPWRPLQQVASTCRRHVMINPRTRSAPLINAALWQSMTVSFQFLDEMVCKNMQTIFTILVPAAETGIWCFAARDPGSFSWRSKVTTAQLQHHPVQHSSDGGDVTIIVSLDKRLENKHKQKTLGTEFMMSVDQFTKIPDYSVILKCLSSST